MSTRCGHRVWSGPRAPCAVAFDAPDTADAARGSRKDAHRATHVLLASVRSLVISSSPFSFFLFLFAIRQEGPERLRQQRSRGVVLLAPTTSRGEGLAVGRQTRAQAKNS